MQKNYSMSFKLQVVSEIERGETSVKEAASKYGIQNSNGIKRSGCLVYKP